MTNPPITQWRITCLQTGETRIANGWQGSTIDDAVMALGGDTHAWDFEVHGRRRLNDYVGSPIWSPWEPWTESDR